MFCHSIFSEKMKVFAPAKINLALDVLGKDPSGYHHIHTVFQEIPDLYDEIEIVESEVSTSHPAIQLLKGVAKTDRNVAISIKKNIPRGSGLGGESSCTAAILKALNALWELNLTTEELQNLAAQLSADAPFFILGGTALGTHFGEKIEPLPAIEKIHFKIIARGADDKNKTRNAYKKLDLSSCGQNRHKTKNLISAIQNGDAAEIIANLHNDFETITPVASGEHLSGSGPSTFKILLSP